MPKTGAVEKSKVRVMRST